MAKKLFVGNLSWGVSDDDFRDMFAAFGEITDSVVMKDRETGRSRGFGFVTFANDEDADRAIEALNEKEVDGRAIVVNEAKPREDRGPRDFNSRRPRY